MKKRLRKSKRIDICGTCFSPLQYEWTADWRNGGLRVTCPKCGVKHEPDSHEKEGKVRT